MHDVFPLYCISRLCNLSVVALVWQLLFPFEAAVTTIRAHPRPVQDTIVELKLRRILRRPTQNFIKVRLLICLSRLSLERISNHVLIFYSVTETEEYSLSPLLSVSPVGETFPILNVTVLL